MAARATNPRVDAFIDRATVWREEFTKLRSILLGCDLAEDLKWGQPCYRLDGRNVVLMHGFKDYCALLFFKGALMDDPQGMLVQQTENVQAARQIRFRNAADIGRMANLLTTYVQNAIALERSGVKVEFKQTSEFAMPEEFQRRLDRDPGLKSAFEGLTPGRQRAYLLHFAGAKQSRTREARIEKLVPKILAGLGLND